MKHRSEDEIIALILEAINDNSRATQTRIMYEAYLSYAQLKGFLSLLLEKDLIEYHKGDRLFTTTEKGMHFLQVYNQISNMLTATTKYGSGGGGGEDSHLTYEQARTNSQWRCEKCQKLLTNHKELKLHKLEYHSY